MSTPDHVVVDTSAVMAILLGEGEDSALLTAFAGATMRFISGATVVELGIVSEGRLGGSVQPEVERFVSQCEVIPVSGVMATLALDGWRRYGKGRHPAGLNYGDCFTYALSRSTGVPILCVGDDFPQTDAPVVDLGPVPRPR